MDIEKELNKFITETSMPSSIDELIKEYIESLTDDIEESTFEHRRYTIGTLIAFRYDVAIKEETKRLETLKKIEELRITISEKLAIVKGK